MDTKQYLLPNLMAVGAHETTDMFFFETVVRLHRAGEGDPDLLDRIADERNVTTVDDLLAWLEAHNHPTMAMESMF